MGSQEEDILSERMPVPLKWLPKRARVYLTGVTMAIMKALNIPVKR